MGKGAGLAKRPVGWPKAWLKRPNLRRPVLMRVILLVAAATTALFGQQYPFLNITGDSHASSFMLLDHRGGLWVNASGSLRYFDGQHFFSLDDLGMPKERGGYLAEDSDGGIWIATGSLGLYRFYGGSLQKEFDGYARDIVAVRPGLMLVFTGPAGEARPLNPDIYRFAEDHGKWTGVKLADWKGRSGDYPKVERDGTVTYACDRAWCELPAQTIADWHPGYQGGPLRHPDPYPGLESVLRDKFGCVWFRSPTLTASYQCPGDPAPTALPVEIAGTDLDIWEGSDGSIWLPSGSRLTVGRPGNFRVIRAANGLPDTNHVVVSSDGTAWLSGSNGLFRWEYPFQAEYWTAHDGLDLPYSPLGTAGRMLAVSGPGIAALSAGRDRWLPLGESGKLGGVLKLFPGPGNTLYATLNRGGVAQLNADGTVVAQSHTPLDPPFYQYLVPRTPSGPIWFSDAAVARVVRRGSDLQFVSAPLTSAPDQKLAACYASGLVTLESSKIYHVSKTDGLLENSCMCLKILPNGDVWFGYISADAFALIRRDGASRVKVHQYHTGDDHTYSFELDSRGWIWRGGVNAIHVADPRSAEEGKWIDLDNTDGFRSTVLAEAFFAGADGSMWWGTQESSIYHFTPPPDFVRPTRPPNVFLSGYSWNGGAPQFAESVRTIPYGANLTALVGSLQFDRRNAMRFRYRLTPDQPAWRDTRSFDVSLGKLPWGSHKLELQAKLLNGPWSAVQSEIFEVAKPFWIALPFLLGCAGVGLSAAAAGYRWHSKQRERADKAFPNLAEWRLATFSPEVQGLIGEVLDSRYRLNRVIARGGFATVLDGIDLREGQRPCAVKVFRRELSDKDWLRGHFEREVGALEQVRHPNVVQIYSHGTTPAGSPYLAMEFIEGQTLRELLNEGALTAKYSATLLRQAGAALEAIHGCGICHRDLKPENLMIRSAGAVETSLVIIDFSIAIVRKPDETIHGLSRAAGTIYYMAPEQAIGYADVTTDIYSLTKVLLEMLTGALLSDLLPDASMDLPNRVRELLASLPVELSAPSIELIASALEFDPARRPRSVREFAEVIAQDLESSPSA
jgi:hypothetical protein